MARFVVSWLGSALVLCWLSLACSPATVPPTPAATSDAFVVVRATSAAAYQAGQAALNRGDYLQACILLDTAKTNDPDNRPEIQQALDQALARCLTPPPTTTAPPASGQVQTIVVATVAAGLGTAIAGNGTPGPAQSTPTRPTVSEATPGPAQSTPTTPPVSAATSAPTTTTPIATQNLVAWNDPQGRFSISAPADWKMGDHPQSLVGTGVVEFQDPSGLAEADVSVDSATKAVSPELYAASLELAMQKQVAGYASEQIVPGNTAGNPSVRRVFTFTQRDATGQDHQSRGFQLTVVKGSTPYIISGSAPATQYEQYSPTFDRIVETFRFS